MLDRSQIFKQTGRAQDEQGSINIHNAIMEQFYIKHSIPSKDPTENAVMVAFEYVPSRARRGK